MSNTIETEIITIDSLNMNAITEEQVHHVYEELADVDKASTDNLAAAEKETEESNYTSEDNKEIEFSGTSDLIPGVDVIPANIAETVEEKEKDIKEVLEPYDLDTESMMQMMTIIEEYKSGNTSCLYSRLPKKIQDIVNGILLNEVNGQINYKQLNSMRNNISKMLVDDFINDAKISAAVDEFNAEIATTVNEMNEQYDTMMGDAIDSVFNRIEEIRLENPEQAERIELVKKAFDNASTFEKQLEFAKNISPKKLQKHLVRFADDVYYFNKRVNNNTFGVKINNIEELIPIIKFALPQYTEEDIKKFIICICRTIEDIDTIEGISYEYRMISSIYRYKFTNIDEKGEVIFENISKVIDVILS